VCVVAKTWCMELWSALVYMYAAALCCSGSPALRKPRCGGAIVSSKYLPALPVWRSVTTTCQWQSFFLLVQLCRYITVVYFLVFNNVKL
jgi:hypothetical protein